MKSIFPLLIIVFMISTSCDEGSFSWESNPPEVRLVILNESDLADKAIGDSINIELGLELYNMQNLYSLDFEVHFDYTIFSADSFNYEIFPSFFSTTGDPIVNDNGDGVWEEGEYIDINANGMYDEPVPYPQGFIRLDTTEVNNELDVFFVGALGIPSPEHNGGNAWGTGRVCEFYLSGILTESLFNINIIQALEYQEDNSEPAEHSLNTWDIFTLLVGSPHDPVLRLQQENQSGQNSITISLQIDDAPKIAQLQNIITYDQDVLSLLDYSILDYFDQTNYQVGVGYDNHEGMITLDVTHNVVNTSVEVAEESFSQGFGEILEVTFLVINEQDSTTTLTLPKSSIYVMGYSLNESNSYPFDLNYWTIEESLEVNF
jgi:hypothetical protein